MSEQAKRMAEIEKVLALEYARGILGCECYGHVVEGKQWFETQVRACRLREMIQADIDRAIEYLEYRGLLERHASKPWAAIREVAA